MNEIFEQIEDSDKKWRELKECMKNSLLLKQREEIFERRCYNYFAQAVMVEIIREAGVNIDKTSPKEVIDIIISYILYKIDVS